MTVQFDEWAQFTDTSGTPLTGGKLYIGTVNLAPKTNLITIYSDRDLTVAISNPQTLDAYGKATTRIFIPGKYSYLVEDSAVVQQEIALDAGAETDTGTTSLDSVLGTNTITASGEATTVTSLTDKEVYTFKVANTITGATTLKIDATDAKSCVKNFNQALDGGDWTQNQVVRVAYNSTSDNFAWVDASVKTKRITKGSDIASASSITIPDNDGNRFDITGTTTIATINGVVGTYNTFQMDGAVTFTNSAGLAMKGGVDFTSAAGDELTFYQVTSSTVINTNNTRADGLGTIAGIVIQKLHTSTAAVATSTTVLPYDDTIPQITEGVEVLTQAITPNSSTSIIRVEFNCLISHSVATEITIAVFVDATAGALAAVGQFQATVTGATNMSIVFEVVSGSTTARTYRIRAGGSGAGTLTINGGGASRRFGGVASTTMTVEERLP